jgi:hypothetical protein
MRELVTTDIREPKEKQERGFMYSPSRSDCNHHSTGKTSGTNCEVLPELKFCPLGLSLHEAK